MSWRYPELNRSEGQLDINELIEAAVTALWLLSSLSDGGSLRKDLGSDDQKALSLLAKFLHDLKAIPVSEISAIAGRVSSLTEVYKSVKDGTLSAEQQKQEINDLFIAIQLPLPSGIDAGARLFKSSDQISESGGPKQAAVEGLAKLYGCSARSIWTHLRRPPAIEMKDAGSTESLLDCFFHTFTELPSSESEVVARVLGEYIKAMRKEETSGFFSFMGELLGSLATNAEVREYFSPVVPESPERNEGEE
jgi:hypothetical protein